MAELHPVLLKSYLGKTLVRINSPTILESLKQMNVLVPVFTLSKFSGINQDCYCQGIFSHSFPSILHLDPCISFQLDQQKAFIGLIPFIGLVTAPTEKQ